MPREIKEITLVHFAAQDCVAGINPPVICQVGDVVGVVTANMDARIADNGGLRVKIWRIAYPRYDGKVESGSIDDLALGDIVWFLYP